MMAAAPRPSPRRRSSCSRLSRKSRLCSAGPHQPSPHTGPRTNCSIKTNPPPSVRSPAAARRQVDIFLQMPACLSPSNGLLVQAECGEPVPAMLTVRGQSCTNSQVVPLLVIMWPPAAACLLASLVASYGSEQFPWLQCLGYWWSWALTSFYLSGNLPSSMGSKLFSCLDMGTS